MKRPRHSYASERTKAAAAVTFAMKLAIEHLPWHMQLSDAARQNLMQSLRLRRYTHGQKVITKGNAAEHWFILLQGSVRVDKESFTIDIHAISSFGEDGCLWDRP